MDIGEIKNSLNEFCPVELTDKYVDTLNQLNTVEHNIKVERAKLYLKTANSGDKKPTAGVIEATIDIDPLIQSLEADKILREGNFIRAKLEREDYYEKFSAVKKIANLEGIEIGKFEV